MKLKLRNPMWEKRHLYFFEIAEFNEYEGDEVKVKWITSDELALSTSDKEFPFRILQKKNIIEVDGKPFSYAVKSTESKTRTVQGSNGKTYQVTGNYKCTCPGFTFRGSCKHLEMK
jgi:hypothetical protein